MSERETYEPGIYPDLTFEQYAEARGLNASLLAVGQDKSMKHLRHEIDNPRPDTPAMRIGRARHAALFERDRFADCYYVCEETNRRTKAYREEKAEAEARGLEVISEDEVQHCTEAALAALEHPQVASLLTDGQPEVSVFAEVKGVPVKGRLDWLRDDAIVDLKTTNDIRPHRFCRTYAELMYHLKLGWYRHLVQLVTGKTLPVFIILQEQNAPYDCTRVRVDPEDLDWGTQLALETVGKVITCKRTGQWPGMFPDGDTYPLTLPDFAMPSDLELTMNGEDVEV